MRQVEKTLGTLREAGKELVTGITQGMTQPHCQEIRKRYLVPDQEKGDPSVYTAGPREAEDSGPSDRASVLQFATPSLLSPKP